MKIAYVLGLLMLTGIPAEAKLAPDQRVTEIPPAAASPDQWSILSGPAGAMLESDYFRGPSGPFNSKRGVSCRLDRQRNGSELRLVYSCR